MCARLEWCHHRRPGKQLDQIRVCMSAGWHSVPWPPRFCPTNDQQTLQRTSDDLDAGDVALLCKDDLNYGVDGAC